MKTCWASPRLLLCFAKASLVRTQPGGATLPPRKLEPPLLVWADRVRWGSRACTPPSRTHPRPTRSMCTKKAKAGSRRPGLAVLAPCPQASPGLLFPLRPRTVVWKGAGSYLWESHCGSGESRGSWPSFQLEGGGNSPLHSELPMQPPYSLPVAKLGRCVACLSLPYLTVYQSTVSELLTEQIYEPEVDFCGRRKEWCWKHWPGWGLWWGCWVVGLTILENNLQGSFCF